MTNLDDLAHKTMREQIDEASIQTMKEEVWHKLENELSTKRNLKKKKRWISLTIVAAVAFLIVFSLQSETGMAVVNHIKAMFEPEKIVVQNIEGNEEETDVQLNEGTGAEYVIYIDESRYKLVKGETSDIITTKEPLGERYPEVSMEIKQVVDIAPEELVKLVEAELKHRFPDLLKPIAVTDPVEGYELHGIIGGQDWDSPVVHAYVISNGKSGSFVITERYFLEAAEGHGARFYAMLKEFHIVEE